MKNRLGHTVLLCFLSILLSGCPRTATIDLYNNTGVDVSVNTGGHVTHIPSKANKSLEFGSQNLIVESSLGRWRFGRNLIPYGGEKGPYFDGTIHIQLNSDGQVFATKEQDKRPIIEFLNQPEGFPLEPSS